MTKQKQKKEKKKKRKRFPFLHDYDVKMPNFAFYGVRKQATTKFYFSF